MAEPHESDQCHFALQATSACGSSMMVVSDWCKSPSSPAPTPGSIASLLTSPGGEWIHADLLRYAFSRSPVSARLAAGGKWWELVLLG
jgi:hypothetical protein